MVGLVIGRFRITRWLGQGGMAEVYEAKHELMDRYAAVKLLRPEMSARDIIVRRFLQEAQAAARIDHPGIVHVYDVGHLDDGRVYLVMELLHGETLQARLQRHQRLSLEATVTIIRQLAGVLGAAHQAGIVHRDLKPDNIFLVPDPEMPQGERVKVLDFGLAKLLEEAFPDVNLTAQGAVFGTPAYMAPEQCRSSASVDQRADIYAIGCIFYMCLCGRAPFGTGGIEVLVAHVGQEPAPPRQHAPDIPPAIEELILQLLAKDRDRRLPSCESFIAHLDRVVEKLPDALFPSRQGPASDELTMRDNPTLQGALAFAAMQVAGAPPAADEAPAAPGAAPGVSRRETLRRGVVVPVAPRTQQLDTRALVPLEVEEETDRIAVPASALPATAGPSSVTAHNPVPDAEHVETLSEAKLEPVDEAEHAHERETVRVSARALVHERTTSMLPAAARGPAAETVPLRKHEPDAIAHRMRTSSRAPGEQAHAARLPGVPERAEPRRPLPGVPETPADAPAAAPALSPTATPHAGTPMRAPAQAMQLQALPWQPEEPDAGAQPAESASDKAGRASTPTLSSGELEPRRSGEPARKPGRRAVWAMAGLACVTGLVAAGLAMGTGNVEPPVEAKPVETDHVPPGPIEVAPTPPVATISAEETASQHRMDELLLAAEEAIAAKDLDTARDKLADANALGGLEAQRRRLDDLARRLIAERKSQKELEQLRDTAGKQRIEGVLEALGRIPAGSVYRPEAQALALEAVDTRAHRLARAAKCQELTELIAAAARAWPESSDQLQAHGEECARVAARVRSQRDPAEILEQVRNAYKDGDFGAASRSCRELRKLGHVDEQATTLCGLVACKAKDRATAAWWHARPWPRSRSMIAQTCLKQGFDVQKKPAP